MDIQVLAIFVFSMLGCGISCYAIGKKEGIQATITHLVSVGLLTLDDSEE
jgi:hypothetical protein